METIKVKIIKDSPTSSWQYKVVGEIIEVFKQKYLYNGNYHYITTDKSTKQINRILGYSDKYIEYYLDPEHCCTREQKLKRILKLS